MLNQFFSLFVKYQTFLFNGKYCFLRRQNVNQLISWETSRKIATNKCIKWGYLVKALIFLWTTCTDYLGKKDKTFVKNKEDLLIELFTESVRGKINMIEKLWRGYIWKTNCRYVSDKRNKIRTIRKLMRKQRNEE